MNLRGKSLPNLYFSTCISELVVSMLCGVFIKLLSNSIQSIQVVPENA